MTRSDHCNIPCYKIEVVDLLKKQMPDTGVIQQLAGLFGLLADPTRLRIISALASGEELCVCDVANVIGLSLSAISHQLRKLRDAGVVAYRNDGRMAYYRLRDGFLAGMMLQAKVRVEELRVA